jgi:diguanylate cyclase (GGDEF)-like protein/PAS domain S-box-containing protein
MKPADIERLASYVDLMMDAICVVDAQGRFVYVSAAAERIFGYRPEELVGVAMLDLVHPDDHAHTIQGSQEVMSGGELLEFENRYIRKDGAVVDILWSARWSTTYGQRVGVARDITERKRAERIQAAVFAISEAALQSNDLPNLCRHIHKIIGALIPVASLVVELIDANTGETSFPVRIGVEPDDTEREALLTAACAQVHQDANEHGKKCTLASPGCDWLGVQLRDNDTVIGALVVYDENASYSTSDAELLVFVSAQVGASIHRTRMVQDLRTAALYDPLTGLPNRALFHDRICGALTQRRERELRIAVLYVDLDGFKAVNDIYGHEAGDKLLQQAGRRIHACLRRTDTVSRFGGDEFVVLLEGLNGELPALAAAEKVLDDLSAPYDIDGVPITVRPSIGVALSTSPEDHEAMLIRRADQAMYTAKRQGGGRISLWVDPE